MKAEAPKATAKAVGGVVNPDIDAQIEADRQLAREAAERTLAMEMRRALGGDVEEEKGPPDDTLREPPVFPTKDPVRKAKTKAKARSKRKAAKQSQRRNR